MFGPLPIVPAALCLLALLATASLAVGGVGNFRNHGVGPLSYRSYNGNAMVIYAPGMVPRVNRVCASIRLKNMRDGVEEYEMMQLLSELDGDRKRADGVIDRIVFAPYGKASIGNLEAWNHNPRQWDEARIRLGEMIEGAVAP